MPQTTNPRVERDRISCPIGKGTVYNSLLDISNATRARAAKVNIIEAERTRKINKIIDKNQRHIDYIQNRMKEKTEKKLRELQAFQQVLKHDYRVENFKTMERGYKRELVQTPRTARRFKIETRVYYSGFDMKSFKPEIDRKIRQMDPSRTRRIMKKILLEQFKDQSDILIDRNLSEKTFYEMLDNRHNLKRYMYQRKQPTVTFDSEERIIDKDELKENCQERQEDDIIEEVANINQQN